MPECTLCGKKVSKLNKIELEGTIVDVCDSCVKFGRVIETKLYKPITKKIQFKELAELNNMELAPDYGVRIKKARESRGLSRIEFARAINERESVIRRIEAQIMEPDNMLAKKIERFLKIKLIEKYEI